MHKIIASIAIIAGASAIAVSGASATELSALCAPKAGAAADASTLSDAKIRSILSDKGYTNVRGIGTEEGCVEAKGLDNAGKRFEVYLHPVTGEIVKTR